jgi:hypothetical protein
MGGLVSWGRAWGRAGHLNGCPTNRFQIEKKPAARTNRARPLGGADGEDRAETLNTPRSPSFPARPQCDERPDAQGLIKGTGPTSRHTASWQRAPRATGSTKPQHAESVPVALRSKEKGQREASPFLHLLTLAA